MRSLYNYPRLIILILVFITTAGLAALQTMPRLEDPHLKGRVNFVITRFPGASAERVEALVSEPIENKLREVAEVKEVRSTSRPGISVVIIELKDEVLDADAVNARLRDKLAELTDLPEAAMAPRFDDDLFYAMTVLVALKWNSDAPVNYGILGRHLEELEVRIKNVLGTDFTRIFGLPTEEITVALDDDELAVLGLTPQQVARRLFQADAKGPAGFLNSTGNRFVVSVHGEFDTLQRIRNVPVSVNQQTGLTRIGDVAEVTRGFRKPADSFALIDRTPAVVLGARMLQSARVDEWTARVEQVVADYRELMPASVSADIIFEQAAYTETRLNELMGNLIVGALVVILVLLVTLGWKAAFISGSVLPLAALTALAILNALGYQIQQMVVTGMIVGLGIMVDNAIVLTDEIQTRLLNGEKRSAAVANTIQKLWLPLMGSTITTVIAFMPILLMPGNAGEFVGGISASVIASLIASYIISFTIISALAGRVLGRPKKERAAGAAQRQPRRWWKEGIEGRGIANAFRWTLSRAIARPWLTIATVGILPLGGFILASTLTEQFFPPSDRDQFNIEIELPNLAVVEETRALVRAVDEVVLSQPEIVSAQWFVGESAPRFYYNLTGNRDGVASYAQGMITAQSLKGVQRAVPRLQRLLDEQFPQARILVRTLEQGPPYDAPLELKVVGPDLEVLRETGDKAQQILMSTGYVAHVRQTLRVGRPELVVRASEPVIATIGLDLRQVADQLQAAIDGQIGGTVLEATEEVPVRIRLGDEQRSSVRALRGVELILPAPARSEDGGFLGVPLTAVARVDLKPSIGSIPREDGERMNAVQGFTAAGVLPETALALIQPRLEELQASLPPGHRLEIGGESAERNEAVSKLMAQAGVLVVLMIIAIVLTFNSFRLAAITFFSAIQAAGLGLFALWVGQYPLGFVVIVGVMGLIGLAINAAIVILTELKMDPAARRGEDEAIVHGVMSCGRHIGSTTLTTVGGFMPLIIAGSDFWVPFAVSIAGGTFLSMIVSFYFAPAAFKIAMRRRPLQVEQKPTPAAAEPQLRAAE